MKVNHVSKAQKDQGKCRCGHEIKAGEAYKWAKGRFGPRMVRCSKCYFRPSDLTGSDKLSQLYAAREAVEDFLKTDFTDPQEVTDAVEECASEARDVAEQYQESAQNLEGKLNAEELEEKAQQCESWADELENFDVPDLEEGPDDETDEAEEERISTWQQEVISNVEDVLNSLEL